MFFFNPTFLPLFLSKKADEENGPSPSRSDMADWTRLDGRGWVGLGACRLLLGLVLLLLVVLVLMLDNLWVLWVYRMGG